MKSFGVLILIAATVVESLAQICLKVGSSGGPVALAPPYAAFARSNALLNRPVVWRGIGVVLFGLEVFLWTSVLHLLDVSEAFPMGSLCFVGVALLSRLFLGEAVGRVRWLGVLCIIAGTALMTA
jgi:multidrug transporter EmrE-like cation transporter